MIIFLLLIALTIAQQIDVTIPLPQLQAQNGWFYLQTFHLNPHLAKLEIILSVRGKAFLIQPQSLIIQGITDDKWEEEEHLKCTSLLRMPIVMQELKMDGRQTAGIFQFAVQKEQRYHFVIKDCHQMLRHEYDNSQLLIRIRMKVLTNQIDFVQAKEDEGISKMSTFQESSELQEL